MNSKSDIIEIEMTNEAFFIKNDLIVLSISVQRLRLIGLIVLIFFILTILLRLIRRFKAIDKKQKEKNKISKKKNEKVDPHIFIAELHQTLITEMRGTSKQNWIMIMLTVVFITVSIFSSVLLSFFIQTPQIFSEWLQSIMSLFGK